MGIQLYKEPVLRNPVLIAGWPGIGNIGIIAVDTLRQAVKAEELGEIEPWHFFYPKKVVIKNGELIDLEFPVNKFFFKQTGTTDLIFFIGEEQPSDFGRAYSEGEPAYRMAGLVLDVAQRFGCRRAYTSGAAVAPIHHSVRPRVWAVPNMEALVDEVRGYENTILMSDIEGGGGQGNITGLNGLLLGVARKRGMEAICVMGEIPVYLQGLSIPYPKASKSVLEVLTAVVGGLETPDIDGFVERSQGEIEELYATFPAEVREQLDKLRYLTYAKPVEPGPITEEDKKKILEEVDKFFRRESKGD